MKIGLPTNDGTSLAEHFGRSAAFLIFETENGQIKSRAMKTNGAHQAQGTCGHHSAASKPHNHAGILAALKGCEVVICAGIGSRAAEALRSAGITEIIVTTAGPSESIVSAFLAGKLAQEPQSFCTCRH